jgi:hypothetical protein
VLSVGLFKNPSALPEPTESQTKGIRSVKATICKVLRISLKDLFLKDIEDLVTIVNQMRCLMLWCAKVQIFETLQQGHGLPFPISQSYLYCIGQTLRGKSPQQATIASSTLQGVKHAIEFVRNHCPQAKLMEPPAHLGDSVLTALTSIAARQLAANVVTHCKTVLAISLEHWLTNHLRAGMTEEEYANQREAMPQHRKNFESKLSAAQLAAYRDYSYQVKRLSTLFAKKRKKKSDDEEEQEEEAEDTQEEFHPEDEKEEDDEFPEDPPDDLTEQAISFLFSMRREVEELELSTGRTLKAVAVLPEGKQDFNYILIDNTVLCHLYNNYTGVTMQEAKENPKAAWDFFFDLEIIDKLRNNNDNNDKKWRFKQSLRTDGVGAVMLFEGLVLKHKKKKKKVKKKEKKEEVQKKARKRYLKPLEQRHLKPGFVSEKDLLERHRLYDKKELRFSAVDPGVHNLVATVDMQNGATFGISQRGYRHSTQGRYPKQQQATEQLKQRKAPFAAAVAKAPFRKSVLIGRFTAYLTVMGEYWASNWKIASERKFRHHRFEREKHHQAFIDRTLNKFRKGCSSGPNKTKQVLLWGNGDSRKGGFMRVRGGGVKGPVLKIKRLLSREFTIICCSEHRTSKCCIRCGHVLQHPKRLMKLPRSKKRRKKFHLHCRIPPKKNELADLEDPVSGSGSEEKRRTRVDNGISFCSDAGHHSFLNRDYDAAGKIGLRFLAQLQGDALGAWSFQVKAAELNKKKWPQLFAFAKQHFPNGLYLRYSQSGRKLVPLSGPIIYR